METKNIFIKLAFLCLLIILQVGCNKGSNSTSRVTNTGHTNNGYYTNNGYCYSNTGQQMPANYCADNSGGNGYYMNGGYCYSSNGQVVSNNYCSSNGNSAYTWSNGYCYSAATGQTVNSSYCSSSNMNNMGSQCVGTYYYSNGSGYTPVSCNGTNCRGYTVYDQNGAQIYCQ